MCVRVRVHVCVEATRIHSSRPPDRYRTYLTTRHRTRHPAAARQRSKIPSEEQAPSVLRQLFCAYCCSSGLPLGPAKFEPSESNHIRIPLQIPMTTRRRRGRPAPLTLVPNGPSWSPVRGPRFPPHSHYCFRVPILRCRCRVVHLGGHGAMR